MPQFDVHSTPGRAAAGIPFVVVVQSRSYDHLLTRLVAPLIDSIEARLAGYPPSTPRFEVAGRSVTLDILQMQAIPRERLGPAIGSLADDNDATRIIRALDDAVSRAYG